MKKKRVKKKKTNYGYWRIINAKFVELQRRQFMPEAFIDGALHRCKLQQRLIGVGFRHDWISVEKLILELKINILAGSNYS
jgi:hypothetical protein